jgi:adenine-specific DNA-methyltransferase
MILNKLNPRKSLNKAFLKVKPNRTEIEIFKSNLIQLIDQSNDTESEEFHKNLVSDFLKRTYFDPKHFINTKGRNDLVIYHGKDAKSRVGVIIETKKPTNKNEMVSADNLNKKAFHELILYYLRERITHKNLEIRHLIATNINEWVIFDATTFDRLFAQNKKLVKQFEDFESGRLADTKTDFFYKQIAEPFINETFKGLETPGEFSFTHFDLHAYDKHLRGPDKKDDNKLIALFKLFSPEHLLKLPFANDSNSLDKKFYSELLHIIGLTETKDGGKKVIQRNKAGERHTGSLLENTVIQLDALDKIHRLDKPGRYGDTIEDRLLGVGLELSITWVNRILFLKLLEAQLIAYHKGDDAYAFLNFRKINNYDDLNSLFFQVLAKELHQRNEDVKEVFAKVPYLNSSLFEPSELEHNTIFISNLRDEKTLPVLSNTVLKDDKGKKRTGELNALEYLLAFLDAYDFSSEGAEDIQEDNKTLINASVLGLIFEKINGYKDGSFFTPGFITMYMCRETIRKAFVQKINERIISSGHHNWKNLETITDVYNQIGVRIGKDSVNEVINNLKICDPAVGSGHFLVSALNEMIALKSELRVLQDRNKKLLRDYHVVVENDELVVTDDDGNLFQYNPNSPESQRVQETLFHEKQTIIENCLFGVDINPNSVKICRLRLWIELLKNAYYTDKTYTVSRKHLSMKTLETLPNIDINIKCGNSLISRFALDADIHEALKKSKWTIDSYRLAVDGYRNAGSKEEKHDMERLINDIKSDFRSEISGNDPKLKKLYKLNGELANLTTQTTLFEMSKKEKSAWSKKVETLTKETKKLETEINEIRDNQIYENAFEWRFEFPEVLNDAGDFTGFDVVIGNPPYLSGASFREFHNFFNTRFEVAEYQLDLYTFFIELSNLILRPNAYLAFITPSSWLKNIKMGKTRKYFLNNFQAISINPNISKAFEEAQVDTLIVLSHKTSMVSSLDTTTSIWSFNNENQVEVKHKINQEYFRGNQSFVFDVEVNSKQRKLIKKIRNLSTNLDSIFEITRGVNPYDKYRGQSQEIIKSKAYHSQTKKDDTFTAEWQGHDKLIHWKQNGISI